MRSTITLHVQMTFFSMLYPVNSMDFLDTNIMRIYCGTGWSLHQNCAICLVGEFLNTEVKGKRIFELENHSRTRVIV